MDRHRETILISRWERFGDNEAKRELWEFVQLQINGQVRGLAKRLGLSDEYEDVLQDTFLELEQKVQTGSLKIRRSLSAFAWGIARNKLLEIDKRRKRLQKVVDQCREDAAVSEAGTTTGDDSIVKDAVRKEAVAQFIAALSKLPESQRSVFCLRVGIALCDTTLVETVPLSIERTAAVFGLSRGWVWRQYTDAKIFLQRNVSGTMDWTHFCRASERGVTNERAGT